MPTTTKVFSEGPMGQTACEQDSPADIHLYAGRLIKAGHRNIRVGQTKAKAVPYETWREQNAGNMPESTMTDEEKLSRRPR